MSDIGMSHVCWRKEYVRGNEHINESYLSYEWVMSLIWISHVFHVNEIHGHESCLTCEWEIAISHICWPSCMYVVVSVEMSHVSPVNESCLSCDWDSWTMSHVSHVTEIRGHESCLTYEWEIALSHVCWPCCMYVVVSVGMSHVSSMNESCLSYEWVMSFIWIRYVLSRNESCLSYEWVMSLVWMSHVSHMNESCLSYERVMSLIWMSHVSHMNESCLWYEW